MFTLSNKTPEADIIVYESIEQLIPVFNHKLSKLNLPHIKDLVWVERLVSKKRIPLEVEPEDSDYFIHEYLSYELRLKSGIRYIFKQLKDDIWLHNSNIYPYPELLLDNVSFLGDVFFLRGELIEVKLKIKRLRLLLPKDVDLVLSKFVSKVKLDSFNDVVYIDDKKLYYNYFASWVDKNNNIGVIPIGNDNYKELLGCTL